MLNFRAGCRGGGATKGTGAGLGSCTGRRGTNAKPGIGLRLGVGGEGGDVVVGDPGVVVDVDDETEDRGVGVGVGVGGGVGIDDAGGRTSTCLLDSGLLVPVVESAGSLGGVLGTEGGSSGSSCIGTLSR